MTTAPTMPKPSLRDQLGPLRASLRPDIEVSRVPFQGEAHYVLRDPLTGRVHRVDPVGYHILCAMRGQTDLASLAAELVEQGVTDDPDDVFETARDLHRSGLVTLPIDDGADRYTRSEAARASKRNRRIIDILFLQIPLWSPDRFLDKTVRHLRFLFTKAAFAVWAMAVLAGLALVIARFSDFTAPLLDLVALERLPWLVVSLVVLKAIHEFGHAYCCKNLGGSVPEMGVMLFVGAPLAYCDATSSWAFSSRRDRIVVGLAGMYFESFAALVALAVWATTGPGPANTIAHQVVFLASVTTLLFNLNPLIRFDGYHILSDVVEIPNLKSRALDELRRSFDRTVLGLRSAVPTETGLRHWFLLGFGVASSIYRVTLTLGICFTIATSLFFVGIGMAVIYVSRALVGFLRSTYRHLCCAEDTAEVRSRAVALAALVFVGIPAIAVLVPVRWPYVARGVVGHEFETVVRAEVGGTLAQIHDSEAQDAVEGQELAILQDRELLLARDEVSADLELARQELEGATHVALGKAELLEVRVRLLEDRLRRAEDDLARLLPAAPMAGTVLRRRPQTDLGRYLRPGDEVAKIGSGALTIEIALDEESLADSLPKPGDKLRVRASSDPSESFLAEVAEVRPAGSRVVVHEALTTLGGGEIVVDPETMQAASPVFEVVLSVPTEETTRLRDGASVEVHLRGEPAPLLRHLTRSVLRFLHEVRQL